MDRRRILRWAFSKAVPGALLGAVGLYYARKVEPANVEIVPVSLVLPRLDPQFDGYRIAQISDLHADDWMTSGRLLDLVKLVNAQAPDLVVITGDFASYSHFRSTIRYVPKLASPLRRLRAPDGVLAVLGNHDHRTDAGVVRRVLARGDVMELRNAVRTLRRDGATLHLCGVDSVHRGMDRFERVLKGLPEEGAAILLSHEPDFADTSAKSNRFDLQLSGHSHGGQTRLPLVRWLVLPKYARRYPDGLYEVDGMFLYTNRGTGTHPRLRILCRPEITIFTLRAPQEPYPGSRGPI